ncbi:MAG: hypothetical protein IKE31_10320 [Eubacterium sp.]|nr:hypothetical protein [Eubacterium sp.]MBR3362193.1 hypothetical protein [Lachnospiraceae bacterium]
MKDGYTKEELREIAEKLIEIIREYRNQTRSTTWDLLEEAGYDVWEMDDLELIDIHYTLEEAARKNHIILDSSAHDSMKEGMPFHLDFVVRKQKPSE